MVANADTYKIINQNRPNSEDLYINPFNQTIFTNKTNQYYKGRISTIYSDIDDD